MPSNNGGCNVQIGAADSSDYDEVSAVEEYKQ